MKIHLEELRLAQTYQKMIPFQGLTQGQTRAIIEKGNDLHRWFKTHYFIHNVISLFMLFFFIITEFFLLLWFPRIFLTPYQDNSFYTVVTASLVTSFLWSWLTYSRMHYSIHEGAAHNMIFPGKGSVSRILGKIANNLSRINYGDPLYYSQSHLSHHAKFGTKDDAEFLNFVLPYRFWRAMIPFASFINFSDFVAHRPLTYTRSRFFTDILSTSASLIYGYFIWRLFGVTYILLFIFLGMNLLFNLDRLRQFSEHNLMPIENQNGARSFGPGFWGLWIGGGPWGQPCHWMHHLVPGIPWYQQLILHRFVYKLLPREQRKQYFLQPIIGYPKLLWRLWTRPNKFARKFYKGKIEQVTEVQMIENMERP